jgi:hypothetical protein
LGFSSEPFRLLPGCVSCFFRALARLLLVEEASVITRAECVSAAGQVFSHATATWGAILLLALAFAIVGWLYVVRLIRRERLYRARVEELVGAGELEWSGSVPL